MNNNKYLFERKEDYLYMKISCEYDSAEILFFPSIVKNECEKEKQNKVLVNALGVIGPSVPTIDRFMVGEEIAKILGAKIKLAIVWKESDIDKFAETVAINRGANICVLGNIEDAKKWLLSNEQ